jgi:hypothetical protein
MLVPKFSSAMGMCEISGLDLISEAAATWRTWMPAKSLLTLTRRW